MLNTIILAAYYIVNFQSFWFELVSHALHVVK